VSYSWTLALVLVALSGCTNSTPAADPLNVKGSNVEQRISEPNAADLFRLSEQEAVTLRLLKSHYSDATLKHDENDLHWLQRLVDDKVVGPDQTYELQCLGASLGQVFVAETPLKWVVFEDEFGRDLALQHPKTSWIVFPMTMISKRVEDGEDIDIVQIYQAITDQIDHP
jgi:hypothetical protein